MTKCGLKPFLDAVSVVGIALAVTTARYTGVTKTIVQHVTKKNTMFTMLLMLLIATVIYVHVWNNRISTNTHNAHQPKEEHGDSFYVQRYKLFNDILETTGYHNQYGGKSNKAGFRHEQRLRLWGNKTFEMKPAITQNEDLERASLSFKKFFKINRRSKEISCSKLFEGDKEEQKRAIQIMKSVQQPRKKISPEEYINMTSNCSKFTHDRGYIMKSLTKEEEQFPIAFSILMYKDLWQFERLLSAIYRPQNLICIHVDGKTDDVIFKAVSGISHCLGNVFIASERIKVQWGKFTALEPEIVCMRDLWYRSKTWKYFINLTGQEFPLRTNYKLVQILKIFNGTNAIAGTQKGVMKDRWKSAGSPPYGVKPIQGSVHIAASRAFVGYIVDDQRATDVLNWTIRTEFPDEHFFQILNFNPGLNAPGFYKGKPETDTANRFKNWGDWPCAGKYVRNICIFGTGDLPQLAHRKELFANKFHQDYQWLALACMEELHFNRTLDQYLGETVDDFRWYSTLDHVKNKQVKLYDDTPSRAIQKVSSNVCYCTLILYTYIVQFLPSYFTC